MKKIVVFLIIFFLISIFVFETIFIFQSKNKKVIEIPTNYTNIEIPLYYNILEFEITSDDLYLAVNGEETINYILEAEKNYEEEITFTSLNPKIARVNKYGNVTGVREGRTQIEVTLKDEIRTIDIIVTDLILNEPTTPSTNKTILTCGLYSKEENDLLDEILESRVSRAGLSTSAGVIAAARFITLEFPYRLSYFSENGRLTTYGKTNYVDGEGRYYHKGLYLHEARTTYITKSLYGPKPWGCYLYSIPSEGRRKNGFDCSGFVAWILLNGGFDPGDIGAGISNVTDMTDLGEKKKLKDSLNNKELKAGDLLSGEGRNGGHIAMVIGIKDDEYYVAESLWGNGSYGAVAKTYTKENLTDYFYWQIDMDTFYQSEGNYTEYWL